MARFAPEKNITSLSAKDIPPGTTYLDLTECHLLTNLNLSDFPLITINFNGCSQLEELPIMPNVLITIDPSGRRLLRGPKNPEFFVDSPEKISKISTLATDIFWNACEEFYKTTIDADDVIKLGENYPTLALLIRFLTENAEQKDGFKKIFATALDVMSYISNNPSILPFTDEISKNHLTHFENDQAVGFVKIAIITQIAKEQEILAKLEFVRILMAMDEIKKITDKIIANPRQSTKLFNAMLVEVCKDGIYDWPGVSHVLYRDTIEEYLTEKNIKNVFEAVGKVSSKPIEIVANFACNQKHLQDFWANTVLSKEELQEKPNQQPQEGNEDLAAASAELSQDTQEEIRQLTLEQSISKTFAAIAPAIQTEVRGWKKLAAQNLARRC